MYATIFRGFAVVICFVLLYSDAHVAKICKIPNADAGNCILLNKCDPLHALEVKKSLTETENAFLRQSVASCGSNGKHIMVCCPPVSQWESLEIRPVIYPMPPNIINRKDDVTTPLHNRFDGRIHNSSSPSLPMNVSVKSAEDRLQMWYAEWKTKQPMGECGMDTSSGRRIVGGNATAIDEYPWIALLEYEPRQFKCGGSLISARHVLTAAHCLYIMPSQVRLSEYNITSEPTDEVDTDGNFTEYINVTIVGVEWAVPHPNFVYTTLKNDIGLIKMKQNVNFGFFIRPICLPTVDYATHFNKGTKFIVAGWGSDNVLSKNSEVKRSVYLPYVPMDECAETMIHRELSQMQQLCAGGKEGSDSCKGDSGGPLMYTDPSQDKFVLVGIVSYGHIVCGTKNWPGVYTYVYNYVDWITETVKND